MPPKNDRGTEITSAQGHDTTRKVRPRSTQSAQSPPNSSGGTMASTAATPTTMGVYTRAKRVMKFSVRAFFSAAFSTNSRMRLTVESSKGFVARTVSLPVRFTQPEITSSPGRAVRGTDSPVSAAVSIWLSPVRMTPSSGMRSPGMTMNSSSGASSKGSTCFSFPSSMTLANSGAMSIISAMDFRDLSTA